MTSTDNNTGGASRRTPRFCFLALSLILSGCVALTGCVGEDEPENVGLVAGDPLPDFAVTMSDGSVYTTRSLEGKWGVIEFFNTGCGDCRENLPELQEVYEYYIDNPEVVVIAIAREEDADEIEAYWTQNGLTVPWSAQADRSIYNLFATVGIPRMYISNPEGVIVAAYGPEDAPSAAEVVEVLGIRN